MNNATDKLHLCGLLLTAVLWTFAGCSLPPINLETQEPIRVDINMRLDVYQYGADEEPLTRDLEPLDDSAAEIERRRRNRMGEIQVLKNSRLVGENRKGLLEIRSLPPGDYGDYVQKTVEEENRDRNMLMQKLADQQEIPLDHVMKEKAELFRNSSFRGEWIEAPVGDDRYEWKQKETE